MALTLHGFDAPTELHSLIQGYGCLAELIAGLKSGCLQLFSVRVERHAPVCAVVIVVDAITLNGNHRWCRYFLRKDNGIMKFWYVVYFVSNHTLMQLFKAFTGVPYAVFHTSRRCLVVVVVVVGVSRTPLEMLNFLDGVIEIRWRHWIQCGAPPLVTQWCHYGLEYARGEVRRLIFNDLIKKWQQKRSIAVRRTPTINHPRQYNNQPSNYLIT